uniref:Uncharacterized protein n=2 Tax=Chenopodium quinoa TaxID=63459 RepID=A0A803KR04_CHEQI
MSHSHKPNAFASTHDWYSSILRSLSTTPEETQHDILYTYSKSAAGFAAHISPALAAKLRRHPSVLSVIPDQIVKPVITQSTSFMGLSDWSGIWPNTDWASDIVIGVVDSGIWPESTSFHDGGLSEVPASWRGICEAGPDFPAISCNKKLIGARSFYKGYEAIYGTLTEIKSARDLSGHGTHCASTAAGSAVANAGYYRYAVGKARGVATKARIAAYKVLWARGSGASLADILAAMDQAIEDGVHVLSMSIALNQTVDYYIDTTTIGAFRAMQNGVVVVAGAGNAGPDSFSVRNIAPWMLSVGASTIDREFPADVILGNGQVFRGSSLFNFKQTTTNTMMLVTGESSGSRFCRQGELHGSRVFGKMVLCESGGTSGVAKSYAVQQAGGLGMILINQATDGEQLMAFPFIIPASTVTYTAGNLIKNYMSSTANPTARIMFRGTVTGPSPSAPRVAAFSSRGPNLITPEILKPDVIAPGVNILAAWTGALGPSGLSFDTRRVSYNIISGTSMACPHVSGLAALLRKAYPSWSPAAIKSAIMTTAYNLDNSGNNITDLATGMEATVYARGSGHIDPNKALNPGLVYDLDTSDYIAFLCSIGYDYRKIALYVQDASMIDCRAKNFSSPGELNYPSFSAVFESTNDVVRYTRVVKNVGSSVNAVYQVSINAPPSLRINVNPTRLVFNANRKTLSYTITFASTSGIIIPAVGAIASGSIEWSDGSHRVRSPIAAYWKPGSTRGNFAASM